MVIVSHLDYKGIFKFFWNYVAYSAKDELFSLFMYNQHTIIYHVDTIEITTPTSQAYFPPFVTGCQWAVSS